MKSLISLFLLVACTASAAVFQVTKGAVQIPERGDVPTVVLLTDDFKFSFIPPYGYTSSTKEEQRKVDFLSKDGKKAFAVQISAKFPVTLPNDEALKKYVGELYPGAGVIQVAPAITPDVTGRFVDVLRIFPNGSRLTTRHVFLPFSEGTVQIVFTADSTIFNKEVMLVPPVLNSFTIAPRTK